MVSDVMATGIKHGGSIIQLSVAAKISKWRSGINGINRGGVVSRRGGSGVAGSGENIGTTRRRSEMTSSA